MDTLGVALIVGAGSGIGKETALTFAERGASEVIFADHDLESAEAAAQESHQIATATTYRASAVQVDVRDRSSVNALFESVKDIHGRIDYAVNCAGIARQVSASVPLVDDLEYDTLHDVNAKGMLHFLQEAITIMKGQEPLFVEGRSGRRSIGPGSIIGVTSIAGLLPSADSTTYVASKYAARGIIKTAALENMRIGLRINEVSPGFVDTPMLRNGLKDQPEVGKILEKSMPLKRVATAEEVANAIHFLASPGASFITGQTVIIDSGM